jgi:hypothetical protein
MWTGSPEIMVLFWVIVVCRFHFACKGLCLLLGDINFLPQAANNPYLISEPGEHSCVSTIQYKKISNYMTV